MSARIIGFRHFLELLKEAYREFSRDNAMRLSAALAYYAVFSIAPLLLIAIGIVGFRYGQAAAEGRVAAQLSQFLGSQAAKAVQSILLSAGQNRGGATLTGFAALFFGASTVFGQLKDSLNIIWKVKVKDGLGVRIFVRQWLLNFGLVFSVGFLLLVSLIATTLVAGLAGWLESRFGVPAFVSGVAGFVAPFLIEVVLFAAIFKVLPDAEVQWRSVWSGAVLTALLFEIGKVGLSFYLGRGSVTSSFGAAGSVVLLLVWVYYASCILFFGAEFTVACARRLGVHIRPSPYAEATEVWTAKGWMPVECSDSPVVAEALGRGGDANPSGPPHETLAPLLAVAQTTAAERHTGEKDADAPMARRFQEWIAQKSTNPAAELGLAVGAGLLAGVLLRLMERRPGR
jgi:membrane protein